MLVITTPICRDKNVEPLDIKVQDVFAAAMKNLNFARGHYYNDVLEPISFNPEQSKCLENSVY